jgi:hypothetical protein
MDYTRAVVAFIWLEIPTARKAERISRLFEAAVMQHFSAEAILHVPSHHFHKGSIEVGILMANDLIRIDYDGRG